MYERLYRGVPTAHKEVVPLFIADRTVRKERDEFIYEKIRIRSSVSIVWKSIDIICRSVTQIYLGIVGKLRARNPFTSSYRADTPRGSIERRNS